MSCQFQQEKVSPETELDRKRSELAELRSRHGEARAALQQLQEEIRRFEAHCDRTLGRRMAELEQLEAEVVRLTAKSASSCGAGGSRQRCSSHSQKPRPDKTWNSHPLDIKSLYREVAKSVHPDLAGGDSLTPLRTELMSKANSAYAAYDRRMLQDILRNWRLTHEFAEGGDDGEELARLNRLLEGERRELEAVDAKLEALKGSYVCRLKLHADSNGDIGSALLADMITAVDINIGKARRRLAELTHVQEPVRAARQTEGGQRSLAFPSEISCGTLYLRNRTSLNYSHWKESGPAQGVRYVEMNQAVRLDVREQAGLRLGYLAALKPHDLQSLFLFDASDADVESIIHLTGLEELYLAGSKLTDAALLAISSLTNLKRLYLYQTRVSDIGLIYLQRLPNLTGLTSSGNLITEKGLAGLQQALPRVKTVSFQWKR